MAWRKMGEGRGGGATSGGRIRLFEVIRNNSVGVPDSHTWQSTNKTIGIWMVRKMMKNNSNKGLIFFESICAV
jgi:hypothetical protein